MPMPDEDTFPPRPVNLTVTLPPNSVMMPSWLVFCFVGAFVVSTFVLFLVWTTNRTLSFEVRALQLYEQDIENVLIRNGIATRADFAPHGQESQKAETLETPNGVGIVGVEPNKEGGN